MGLRAFEPDDASLFFDREEVVGSLLSRLGTGRLLSVVGASGSGKSSLVRAGLVPALRNGALPGSRDWRVSIMTPGAHPLSELAAKLAAVGSTSPTALLGDLEEDPRTLDLTVRESLGDEGPSTRVVVVVDQFEELFTLCRDREERQRFVDALLHAVSVPGGRTMVVLAMRADFYGEAAGYPSFAEALDASTALLGPMDEHDLRAVVEEPARVAGLRVEPGLVDLMVNDVLGEPGGLPLLSHVLLETWQRRDGRSVTTAGYNDAGGVRGAIALTAQSEYQALTADEQAIARNLFVRLTELGEGTEDTRRRASLDEVVPTGSNAAAVSNVIQRLADARLLTTGEDTVEVAHEALIREWPRLRGWLDDDSELYRGSRLETAIDWVDRAAPELNPQERAFLDASRELHERELREAAARLRRLRMLVAGLAGLFVVALLIGGAALVQWNRANDQRDRAEEARDEADALRIEADESAHIAVQNALEFAFGPALEDDSSLGLLLAVEARRRENSVTTRGNLQSALLDEPRLLGYLFPERGRWMAMSPDSRLVAALGVDGAPEGTSSGVSYPVRSSTSQVTEQLSPLLTVQMGD